MHLDELKKREEEEEKEASGPVTEESKDEEPINIEEGIPNEPEQMVSNAQMEEKDEEIQ